MSAPAGVPALLDKLGELDAQTAAVRSKELAKEVQTAAVDVQVRVLAFAHRSGR
jgi:hypothetical protein